MFTAEAIQTAHSKVRSGADFPAYIQEIKAMGVTHYTCYVTDGHINYYGDKDHIANVPAKYAALAIAATTDAETFTAELMAHQQGKTDFLTFIYMCAGCGINSWTVNMDTMTCTYYDQAGHEVLAEQIPG